MGMAISASYRSDFTDHYPFYRLSSRSVSDWLMWEICYVTQFIFLEFFFRGFLLNALRPAIGANAVWFMVLPYLMIHFSKPWLEATGAIFLAFSRHLSPAKSLNLGRFYGPLRLGALHGRGGPHAKNALPSQWLP